MKPSEVLETATNMLMKAWTSGTLQDGSGAVCAMGALSVAKVEVPEYPMDPSSSDYREELQALRKAMVKAPKTKTWKKVRARWRKTYSYYSERRKSQRLLDQITQDALISLNDDERAGQEEVVRVFKAAACIAKQKEAKKNA